MPWEHRFLKASLVMQLHGFHRPSSWEQLVLLFNRLKNSIPGKPHLGEQVNYIPLCCKSKAVSHVITIWFLPHLHHLHSFVCPQRSWKTSMRTTPKFPSPHSWHIYLHSLLCQAFQFFIVPTTGHTIFMCSCACTLPASPTHGIGCKLHEGLHECFLSHLSPCL